MVKDEGMALLTVILLLMIMSSLTAALVISSNTETLIARHHQTAAEARAAAEAGLSHGLEVTISYLRGWKTNGFATPGAAVTDLLDGPDDDAGTTDDNGSLAEFGLPLTPLALGDLPAVTYLVRVFDDDDATGRGITLSEGDITESLLETPGTPYVDANSRVVVRATGYASGNATVTLEAIVTPVALPAIVTSKDLRIDGYAAVAGAKGGVHSNADLELDGNAVIAQDATASASFSAAGASVVSGTAVGGQPAKSIPTIRARDYRADADYILTADGRITDSGGSLICDASAVHDGCEATYGWLYEPDPDTRKNGWQIRNSEDDNAPGTYYVQGMASISGDPGSTLKPLRISILAEGSIDISGDPDLRPDTAELIFVTDGDLRISGDLNMSEAFPGAMLVREQVRVDGTATLFGQIICEGADNTSDLVEANEIGGNATLTHDGAGGLVDFAVSGWRRTP
jgi:hypothetical protein